jgi:hypothetical protein
MKSSRTNLLAALVIVASVCAAVGYARLQTARAGALSAQRDLIECRDDLDALSSAGATRAVAAAAPDQSQLDRLLNQAASEAGTKLSGIEPGMTDREGNGDVVETSVFVRLDALTLRQLVTFLHSLSQYDSAARAKLIELATPQAQESSSDAWAADVTISYRSATQTK